MRVVIVDGFGSGRWLTRALSDQGAECIHVRSRPRLSAYLEAAFQPKDYLLDLGHDSDLAAVAERIRKCGIDWIVAGNESGVRTSDELTHLTGLPGNLYEAAGARRDKHLMAQRLGEGRRHLVRGCRARVRCGEAAGQRGLGPRSVLPH